MLRTFAICIHYITDTEVFFLPLELHIAFPSGPTVSMFVNQSIFI